MFHFDIILSSERFVFLRNHCFINSYFFGMGIASISLSEVLDCLMTIDGGQRWSAQDAIRRCLRKSLTI